MDIHARMPDSTPILREELANKVLFFGQRDFELGCSRVQSLTAKTGWQPSGSAVFSNRGVLVFCWIDLPVLLRSPLRCPSEQVDLVERLRRQRWTGFRISLTLGRSRATVSCILRRLHLSRIRDLEPSAPIVRYANMRLLATCSTSISRRSTFPAVGCRITATAGLAASIAPAGSTHVAIDDHPASPSPRFCPTASKPCQPPLSCRPRLTTMLDSASPSPACSPITVPAIAPAIFANSASSSKPPALHLVLTLHAPTVRPNASSRPLSGNGPTAVLTTTPRPELELPRWLHQYNWHRPHARLRITLRPLAVPVSTGTTC